MTCMKNHAFFWLFYVSTPSYLSCQENFRFPLFVYHFCGYSAARRRHPLSRGGKAMSPPAAGVATRRFAFSSLLQSGQSVACKGIAQLKKTQDPLDICYLFLEESQKASVLGCGINRKCLVFRLEFFLFAVLFEEHATD